MDEYNACVYEVHFPDLEGCQLATPVGEIDGLTVLCLVTAEDTIDYRYRMVARLDEDGYIVGVLPWDDDMKELASTVIRTFLEFQTGSRSVLR